MGQNWAEEDRALIARFLAGEDAAFDAIFDRHRALVFGVLRQLLGDDPELDDVVQNTFLEVFRSLPNFEGRSKLSSWVARIALNMGYAQLRHRKRRPHDYNTSDLTEDLIEQGSVADPEQRASAGEAERRVRRILRRMPEKRRTVFLLAELQGLPPADVAEVLGVGLPTMRTRLFHARQEFWRRAQGDPVLSQLAPE